MQKEGIFFKARAKRIGSQLNAEMREELERMIADEEAEQRRVDQESNAPDGKETKEISPDDLNNNIKKPDPYLTTLQKRFMRKSITGYALATTDDGDIPIGLKRASERLALSPHRSRSHSKSSECLLSAPFASTGTFIHVLPIFLHVYTSSGTTPRSSRSSSSNAQEGSDDAKSASNELAEGDVGSVDSAQTNDKGNDIQKDNEDEAPTKEDMEAVVAVVNVSSTPSRLSGHDKKEVSRKTSSAVLKADMKPRKTFFFKKSESEIIKTNDQPTEPEPPRKVTVEVPSDMKGRKSFFFNRKADDISKRVEIINEANKRLEASKENNNSNSPQVSERRKSPDMPRKVTLDVFTGDMREKKSLVFGTDSKIEAQIVTTAAVNGVGGSYTVC